MLHALWLPEITNRQGQGSIPGRRLMPIHVQRRPPTNSRLPSPYVSEISCHTLPSRGSWWTCPMSSHLTSSATTMLGKSKTDSCTHQDTFKSYSFISGLQTSCVGQHSGGVCA